MENSYLHRLPLELRHQIYQMTFDTVPEPSLLRLNKSFHNEIVDYLRKCQQTFSYNITANSAGFDDFALWCFKIKRHVPRLDRMKHIILNIYPPDSRKPHEMWHIWDHVRTFCKDLTVQPHRITQLTVNFMTTERDDWVTDGIPNGTLKFDWGKDVFGQYDIEQILETMYLLLNNVDKPKIVLPRSYTDTHPSTAEGQEWIGHKKRLMHWVGYTEQSMTGHWIDDELEEDDYSFLEEEMDLALWHARVATGRRSKAMFEKMFGRNAILDPKDYEMFKRDWPYMQNLPEWERPRCRWACQEGWCGCGGSLVEVSLPDPAWSDPRNPDSNSWRGAAKWQQEVAEEGCNPTGLLRSQQTYPP